MTHPVSLRLLVLIIMAFTGGFAGWIILLHAPFGLGPDPAPADIRLAGAVLLAGVACAAVLLGRLYRASGAGAGTSSRLAIVALDTTSALIAAGAGVFIFDGFAPWLCGLPSVVTEPVVAVLIAALFLPTGFIFAAIGAAQAAQRVEADADGLAVASLGGVERLSWGEITAIRPQAQYLPVSRLGIFMPRHLRTDLLIVGQGGTALTIIDPGSRAGRRGILDMLESHLPARLQPGLRTARTAWNL